MGVRKWQRGLGLDIVEAVLASLGRESLRQFIASYTTAPPFSNTNYSPHHSNHALDLETWDCSGSWQQHVLAQQPASPSPATRQSEA